MFHVLDEIQLSSIGNIFTILKCNKMMLQKHMIMENIYDGDQALKLS